MPDSRSVNDSNAEHEGKAVTDYFDVDLDFTPAVERPSRDDASRDAEPASRGRRLGRRPRSAAIGDESPAAATLGKTGPGRRSRSSSWRRRVSGVLIMGIALTGAGLGYGMFAASSGANDTTSSADDIAAGKALFSVTCISCHGANLEGVTDRGPTLIGVGSASVYFQVSTGRMPAMSQGAQAPRKKTEFTDEQVNQLAAYVQSVGGGPQLPAGDLRDGELASGGELFRLNCASCHNFAGKGAPLSAGKFAPSMAEATDQQIYAVMLAGAESMPTFSDNQLTPEQKRSIVNYIQTLKASKDPGGAAIGRAGPVPEGLVIFMIGIAGLMGVIVWIGAKS